MNYEVAIPEALSESAKDHLLSFFRRGIEQEDLCFALWRPSNGTCRMTGLITGLLFPRKDERRLHGNVSFEDHYLARAARLAYDGNTGVAFMHSHPTPGWQGMSEIDIVAERDRIAPPARATGHPLLGLTLGTDGVWSARFWHWNGRKYEREDCQKVRVVGESFALSFHPSFRKPALQATRLHRTIDTWGKEKQALLASLRIGIVGVGSVGTVIAETLARMGATNLLLLDADRIQEHNLDRMMYATSKDIGGYKVDFVKSHIRRSATAATFFVDAMRAWIQERDAFVAALDCDILFAAVDRPTPKDVLNNIAYAHYIPVVFGGVRVATKPDGRLVDATWSVVHAGPSARCLRCDGQYTTSDVMMERDGTLDDPKYIARLEPQLGNENVFPFCLNLGSLMVLEMLRAILREEWWSKHQNKIHYSYVANRFTSDNKECRSGCPVADRIGAGDRWSYPFIDEPVEREKQSSVAQELSSTKPGWWHAIRSMFRGK